MKLIIFDYDGVLVDSFDLTVKCYIDLSREFKLNLPEHQEFYRDLLELDWRETLRKLRFVTPRQIRDANRIFIEAVKKYGEDVRPYRDIPKVLDALSKKYILAIATNNLKPELDYRLKKFDLRKYFSAVFTSEDGDLKPSPDLLMKCMKRFDVRPAESAFIGDMDGDIISGKAAKVGKTVAVTYGYHLKHRLLEADIIIDSPAELLETFRK